MMSLDSPSLGKKKTDNASTSSPQTGNASPRSNSPIRNSSAADLSSSPSGQSLLSPPKSLAIGSHPNSDTKSIGEEDTRSESSLDKRTQSESRSATKSKKRTSTWYQAFSPTYKQRSEDFKRIFKEVPNEERLIVDYSCAMQKDILVHGRLYISQHWVCFYACIIKWETLLTIRLKDIVAVTREKTARVIPNAIQICTQTDKYFFTSFGARDKTFVALLRIWKNSQLDQPLSGQDLWSFVHTMYGEELGLTSDDDDYVAPSAAHVLDLTGLEKEKLELDSLLDTSASSLVDKKETNGLRTLDSSAKSLLNSPISLLHVPILFPEALVTMKITPDHLIVDPNSFEDVLSPVLEKDSSSSDFSDDEQEQEQELESGTPPVEDIKSALLTCGEHEGIIHINAEYRLSVNQMFEYLFTDSQFYKDFIRSRKMFNLNIGTWALVPDVKGNKTRTVSYSMLINSSLGNKQCHTTEKQTMYPVSKPGRLFVIDCEVNNHGVPYCDNFFVLTRYCISRTSAHSCMLRISSELKYRKSVWGIVKSVIEKNCTAGLQEHFSQLEKLLCYPRGVNSSPVQRRSIPIVATDIIDPVISDSKEISNESTKYVLPKKKRRKEGKHGDKFDLDLTADQSSTGSSSPNTTSQSPLQQVLGVNVLQLVRFLLILVFLVSLVNGFLFYKLNQLEHLSGLVRNIPRGSSGAAGPHDDSWIQLLNSQRRLHDEDVVKWKDTIQSTRKIMEQMLLTLETLERGLHSIQSDSSKSDRGAAAEREDL